MIRRGFSLLEVIMVCALMGFVMGGVFLLFRMGTRGFSRAVSESGAVGELQRATRVIQRDLRLTHFLSASDRQREVTTSDGKVERDGLAVAGLANWADPSNFEVGTELPKWNRWILFYADGEDKGRLHRLEIQRSRNAKGSYYPLVPLGDLSSYMTSDPVQQEVALRVSTLCYQLRSFGVEIDPYKRLLRLTVRLNKDGVKRMTSEQRVQDSLEARFEISPMNSYPEI